METFEEWTTGHSHWADREPGVGKGPAGPEPGADQKDLAAEITKKPQVVLDYVSGQSGPNQALGKTESPRPRALLKDRGCHGEWAEGKVNTKPRSPAASLRGEEWGSLPATTAPAWASPRASGTQGSPAGTPPPQWLTNKALQRVCSCWWFFLPNLKLGCNTAVLTAVWARLRCGSGGCVGGPRRAGLVQHQAGDPPVRLLETPRAATAHKTTKRPMSFCTWKCRNNSLHCKIPR